MNITLNTPGELPVDHPTARHLWHFPLSLHCFGQPAHETWHLRATCIDHRSMVVIAQFHLHMHIYIYLFIYIYIYIIIYSFWPPVVTGLTERQKCRKVVLNFSLAAVIRYSWLRRNSRCRCWPHTYVKQWPKNKEQSLNIPLLETQIRDSFWNHSL